jgi:hypothetical protein
MYSHGLGKEKSWKDDNLTITIGLCIFYMIKQDFGGSA